MGLFCTYKCSFYVSFKFAGIVFIVLMISNETVQEFRNVIRKEYSHNLSIEEAEEMLTTLVGYFDVLAQINHQDKLNGD